MLHFYRLVLLLTLLTATIYLFIYLLVVWLFTGTMSVEWRMTGMACLPPRTVSGRHHAYGFCCVLWHSRCEVSAVWAACLDSRAASQRALMRVIPGFTKEKFLNMVWSTLLMSVRSAHDSRGFSLMNSLSKLLQSLGDDCVGGRENVSVRANTPTICINSTTLAIVSMLCSVCCFTSIWYLQYGLKASITPGHANHFM